MPDEPIANMQARAVQCWKLAGLIGNPKVRETLLNMAVEIEADVKRLEAEATRPNED
jgi:hypothetical protein